MLLIFYLWLRRFGETLRFCGIFFELLTAKNERECTEIQAGCGQLWLKDAGRDFSQSTYTGLIFVPAVLSVSWLILPVLVAVKSAAGTNLRAGLAKFDRGGTKIMLLRFLSWVREIKRY